MIAAGSSRSRQRVFVALALLSVGVAACGEGGEVPHDVPVTGYRGGVVIGQRLLLNGQSTGDEGRFLISASPREGVVEIDIRLQEPDCSAAPAELDCPPRSQARLGFRVSALLDLRQHISLEGQPDFTHTATDGTRQFPLVLPELEPGRHCLLLFTLEDAAVVVAGQFADHSAAAFYEISIAGDHTNHCRIEERIAGEETAHSGGDCRFPLLSAGPSGLEVKRSLSLRQPLYPTIPHCGGRTTAIFLHDDSAADPLNEAVTLTVPDGSGGGRSVLPARHLPRGSWRMAVVQDQGASRGTAVLLSPPVVLSP